MSLRGEEHPFVLEMDVRDYECDMEGIVNHAVYLHYLEHARHIFLRGRGIDFADLTRRGIHLVVVRLEVDYLRPLRSGDRFRISLRIEPVSSLRWAFHQTITLLPRTDSILKAKVVGIAVDERGRPFRGDVFGCLFTDTRRNPPREGD